jgi:iron complex transport system permease protein
MNNLRRLPVFPGYCAAAGTLLGALLCGLYFGDVHLSFGELAGILRAGPFAIMDEAIKHGVVWRIRVPRISASAISGAILAMSGVIFQAVLRNPLAEPYTLGVSSGAAFGASLAIYLGWRWISPAAFIGSALSLFTVLALGERKNDSDISRIILSGVIVGNILGAALTLLKAIAGDKLSAIVMWLMGSFSDAGWADSLPVTFSLLLLLLFSVSLTREMDIMASGADGTSLGLNVERTRILLLSGASLSVSFVVSRFGVIGFVGLVVPHFVRILFGPAHRHLIALSLLGGAALLCAADTIAKGFGELPAGVLTVLVGGPVFCFIIWKRK